MKGKKVASVWERDAASLFCEDNRDGSRQHARTLNL